MKQEELSNEQLCALAKNGDADALERLVKQNLPYIKKRAKEIWEMKEALNRTLGVDRDDLEQEGSIGLLNCVESFQPERGFKFLTYAAPAIRNAMYDYFRAQRKSYDKKHVDLVDSLDEIVRDEWTTRHNLLPDPTRKTPEQVYLAKERREEIYSALDAISDREEHYLRYRFGFEDDVEHPLIETAKHFHLSESRAKKTERSALNNVRLELPWWY